MDDSQNIMTADEASLKRQLLIEEILEKRRSAGILPRLATGGTFLASCGALVAAIVAFAIAKNDRTKQIVEAYQKQAELLQTNEQLAKVRTEVDARQLDLQQVQSSIDALQKQEGTLSQQVNLLLDASGVGQKSNVGGVNIRVSVENGQYYIDVTTLPTGATASAYLDCNEDFGFPSPSPPIDKLIHPMDDGQTQSTPCRFGPLLGIPNYVWILVDFGTHKDLRFVNLMGLESR